MSARDEFITGLREFADWLEQNPEVQEPGDQRLLLALMTNPAVEEFAAGHGLTVVHDGEGNASCDLTFGPIVYHAYGYVDFVGHCKAAHERNARSWAQKNGLEIVPAEAVSAS